MKGVFMKVEMLKRAGVVMTVLTVGDVVLGGEPLAEKQNLGTGKTSATLPVIVVTATKLPTAATNVTQKIDVIDEKETKTVETSKGNLVEWLTYQPGTAVSVLSRNDANWGSYGGLGPKYTTFMLDGLPIDAFVDSQALDPWAFERIESQRGPASVLYPNYLSQDFAGSESPLAGTVNFVPRKRITEPLSRLDAGYGSYDTYRLRGYHQDVFGPAHVFGGVSYEDSDYTDYGTKNSWLNMLDDPEYTKLKLYGSANIDLDTTGEHGLTLFGNWNKHAGDAGRPNRKFDHKYTLLQAGYHGPMGNVLSLQTKGGYRRYERTWQEDNISNGGDLSLASDNGVVQNIVPADMAVSIAHRGDSSFTFGADYQYADYETYRDIAGNGSKVIGNDGKSAQYGAYAQEDFTLANWRLRVGGRLTEVAQDMDLLGGVEPGEDHASWTKVLWSIGARYNGWGVVSPFANLGTSFTPPSLKSVGGTLQMDDQGVPGRNGQLPNDSLEPEKGIGGDVGADVTMGQGSTLTVRSFANVVDDAIVENVVSQTPSQSQSVNAGKMIALGAEVAVQQQFSDWLSTFANYTYTHARISNDVDPDQDDADVPFVPQHVGNLGLTAHMPYKVTISPYLHVAGSIYDSSSKAGRTKFDAYELVNLTVRKGLLRDKQRSVELYVEVYNLTNNEFEMPWQFQDPGTSFMMGVEATF